LFVGALGGVLSGALPEMAQDELLVERQQLGVAGEIVAPMALKSAPAFSLEDGAQSGK
jgi:hypothetical protein